MKYYFLTYQTEWNDGSGVKLRNATSISIHPLEWIKNLKKSDDERVFTLVWWTELSKEEYEKYKFI